MAQAPKTTTTTTTIIINKKLPSDVASNWQLMAHQSQISRGALLPISSQRFSELFRIEFLIQKGPKSAKNSWEVLGSTLSFLVQNPWTWEPPDLVKNGFPEIGPEIGPAWKIGKKWGKIRIFRVLSYFFPIFSAGPISGPISGAIFFPISGRGPKPIFYQVGGFSTLDPRRVSEGSLKGSLKVFLKGFWRG